MAGQHAIGAVAISLAVVQLADRTMAITALSTEPTGRKVRFNNARMTTRGFSRAQAGLSNTRRSSWQACVVELRKTGENELKHVLGQGAIRSRFDQWVRNGQTDGVSAGDDVPQGSLPVIASRWIILAGQMN